MTCPSDQIPSVLDLNHNIVSLGPKRVHLIMQNTFSPSVSSSLAKVSTETEGKVLAINPCKKILKKKIKHLQPTMAQIKHFHSKKEE